MQFGGGSTGSGGSSGEESRQGAGQDSSASRSGSSDVDPSSSEQSADTVIYVGPADDATDGEHPPVYIPSLNSGDNRCAMGKALRGSAAERPTKTSQKTQSGKSSQPSKAATSTTEGSPARSVAKSLKTNASIHSSSKSQQSAKPSKGKPSAEPGGRMPVFNAAPTTHVKGSDEQWIDGPRISKSKVAEARSLLKESHKKETWVDGPQAGYGYMDNHKKTMIQRWVENQTVQVQKQIKHTPRQEVWVDGKQEPYKELTVFKTCDESEDKQEAAQDNEIKEKEGSSSEVDQQPNVPESSTAVVENAEVMPSSNEQQESGLTLDDICKECDKLVESLSQVSGEDISRPDSEDDDEEGLAEMPPPLPLLQPHNKEISIGK